ALPISGALTGRRVGNEHAGRAKPSVHTSGAGPWPAPRCCSLRFRRWLAALVGAVDVDLLLGDGVGDLALLLDGLLVQAHALLGHRALLDHGLLGVQRDLVLLLGDRGAVGRVADVG